MKDRVVALLVALREKRRRKQDRYRQNEKLDSAYPEHNHRSITELPILRQRLKAEQSLGLQLWPQRFRFGNALGVRDTLAAGGCEAMLEFLQIYAPAFEANTLSLK